MNNVYKKDPWQIIEEGFHPEMNRESESIFSIGNGYMGQRANFEENYSGESLQGSYVAGVYYPDKTRVGWWKNGYPEYFAKVLNAPKWIGIDISVNGQIIDIATLEIKSFRRILNMKEGYLERSFRINLPDNKTLEISSRRFVSMAEPDLGVIRFSVKSIDFEGTINYTIYIDGDVKNQDTNYGEKFWAEVGKEINDDNGILVTSTLKTDFHVATGMIFEFLRDNRLIGVGAEKIEKDKYIGSSVSLLMGKGEEIVLNKYVSVLSSLNVAKQNLMKETRERCIKAKAKGYGSLFVEHTREWERIWTTSDVVIEGDISAQQAIRFNIFHLNQTYTGKDERLNIGPKGFTGEK
jgi:maltose phosphorylase